VRDDDEPPYYAVELAPGADRTLRKLDKYVARRLVAAMMNLATDPRPAGVKALAGHPGVLRLRVGDYRVVYRVEDKRLLVLVLHVGHRARFIGTGDRGSVRARTRRQPRGAASDPVRPHGRRLLDHVSSVC
jgi:mRNA interferase RelE/StbE